MTAVVVSDVIGITDAPFGVNCGGGGRFMIPLLLKKLLVIFLGGVVVDNEDADLSDEVGVASSC